MVDPASYYFRINPLFETAAEKYDWINRIIAIGHRLAGGPVYSVFEVLRGAAMIVFISEPAFIQPRSASFFACETLHMTPATRSSSME